MGALGSGSGGLVVRIRSLAFVTIGDVAAGSCVLRHAASDKGRGNIGGGYSPVLGSVAFRRGHRVAVVLAAVVLIAGVLIGYLPWLSPLTRRAWALVSDGDVATSRVLSVAFSEREGEGGGGDLPGLRIWWRSSFGCVRRRSSSSLMTGDGGGRREE